MTPATQLLVGRLKELAENGATQDQAAAAVGASRPYLVSFAARHRIRFNRQRRQVTQALLRPHAISARNQRMAELYKQGSTLQEIGQLYGITRERVRQILLADHGLRGNDGGASLTAALERAARLNKMEARYQRKYGCSRADYRAIRKAGGTRPFTELKRNAANAGYKVELKLFQWWTLWQESGHWNDRGRGYGYWLFRPDRHAPLSLSNHRIAPGNEAMSWMQLSDPYRFNSFGHRATP